MDTTKTKKEISLKNWIYFALTALLTVVFVLWTGYWACLILIPLFFDIYISKIVPWGTWKKNKNPKIEYVLGWIDAILFALIGVGIINAFLIQNYQIPTSSLEKSLLVGDFLCVSKISYGGRSPMTPLTLPLTQHTIETLGVKSYLETPQLDYKRFAGTGVVERNNIVVFNFPAGDSVPLKRNNPDYHTMKAKLGRDVIWNNPSEFGEVVYRPVDRRENFVKRCIGLPGETIQLRNDSVFIDGAYTKSSDNQQNLYYIQTDGTKISNRIFEELGVSNADLAEHAFEDLSTADSLVVVSIGLKYENGSGGYLVKNVNLTQAMKEELESKSFVKTIMRRNEFWKRTSLFPNATPFYQDVYPIALEESVFYGDLPPLWIPKRGQTIDFAKDTQRKALTYERCIRNYELNDFDFRDGIVYINGIQANSYTFKMDYYFMMGDNRDKSADSREWGFVPEDHIVGKPLFVWLSLNPDKGWFSGKIRWNRLFTGGNKQ